MKLTFCFLAVHIPQFGQRICQRVIQRTGEFGEKAVLLCFAGCDRTQLWYAAMLFSLFHCG